MYVLHDGKGVIFDAKIKCRGKMLKCRNFQQRILTANRQQYIIRYSVEVINGTEWEFREVIVMSVRHPYNVLPLGQDYHEVFRVILWALVGYPLFVCLFLISIKIQLNISIQLI